MQMTQTVQSDERARAVWLITVAVLLLLVAAAKGYSVFGTARILDSTDPILKIENRWVMGATAVLEAGVVALIFSRVSARLKLVSIFWLGANFLLYHAAAGYLNVKLCPCLGNVTDKLGLPPAAARWMIIGLAVYLFLGSVYFLFLRGVWPTESNPPEHERSPAPAE